MDANLFHRQLPHCLLETQLPTLGTRYRGKVRDTYLKGDRLVLVATDRLSAFDRILTTVPFKGQLLNQLAQFWFERTSHIVRNHVIEVPHPNLTVARACEPFAVEVVVRGNLTGSLWRDYQKGLHTQYGLSLPPGLARDSAFPTPILTPSTKAPLGQHDEPISEEDVVRRGLASRWEWEGIREAALELFREGQRWARTRGLLLVDTKYEFGRAKGALVVIDEMHTPDSSRFWEASEYEQRLSKGEDQRMLDKENIRQWLIRERGFSGHGPAPEIPDEVRVGLGRIYADNFERIRGAEPSLRVGSVMPELERIALSL
jgi:phosphoribosylaminoimidazole-succinocarboxamide synthase